MARLEDSVDRVNYEGGLRLRVNNLRFLKTKKTLWALVALWRPLEACHI